MGPIISHVLSTCLFGWLYLGGVSGLVVKTGLGSFRGSLLNSTTGVHTCAAFFAVPFAKPPTGDRRFRVPEEIEESWVEERSAEEVGPACIQMPNTPFDAQVHQSEDCLILDIVLPHNFKPSSGRKLAVIYFIHGGGFVLGAGALRNQPSLICENFGGEEVIFVMVQYRLGFLGFVSLGDESAPGNLGLWDQIQGLKWVQENIEFFGGDSESVTILGNSAGGASVSLLTYIPQAQTLFHRAWALSGSAFAYWVLNDDSVPRTRELASEFQCNGNTLDVIDCLRERSLVELQTANEELFGKSLFKSYPAKDGARGGGQRIWDGLKFGWNPRVDGILLPSHPRNLITRPKPFVTGTTDKETTLIIAPTPAYKALMGLSTPFIIEDENVEAGTLERCLGEAMSMMVESEEERGRLMELGRHLYLGSDHHIQLNRPILTEHLIRLSSDLWMDVPALEEASKKTNDGGDVWLYSLDYFHESAFPHDWKHKGSLHAEDVIVLFFGVPDSDAAPFARKLGGSIASFARDGVPKWPQVHWPKFESLRSTRHLVMDRTSRVSVDFRRPTAAFWTITLPDALRSKNEL